MNIVDNIFITNKYINNLINKHISTQNNIANLLLLDTKYINKHSKQIIAKYRKYMNQKNIYTIITCVNNKINIIPAYMYINRLLVIAFIKNILELNTSKFTIKYFIDNVYEKICFDKLYCYNLNVSILKSYVYKLFNSGNVKTINYIYKKLHNELIINNKEIYLGIRPNEFNIKRFITIHNIKNVDIVKYLHSKHNFDYGDLKSVILRDNLDMINYFYLNFYKTNYSLTYKFDEIFNNACKNGDLDIIKYFHLTMGYKNTNANF